MKNNFKAGDKVTKSGFDGVVLRQYSEGMWEVRLEAGDVCVSAGDLIKINY